MELQILKNEEQRMNFIGFLVNIALPIVSVIFVMLFPSLPLPCPYLLD